MFTDRLRKLTDAERSRAAARREELFGCLDSSGIRYAADNRAKPYAGDLSPGCRACVNGAWSCIYMNTLCTRHCFYCPQDRQAESKGWLPLTDRQFRFRSPSEYVQYLEAFPFEGIGFSGGEPFLVFDRLTDYIEGVRRAFGARHYIWVYTNGDLVTEDNLKRLKDVALDELRFDLSAAGYEFGPVALAVKYIDTVTIEIPAIPEDLGTVKSALGTMQGLGVKFLNLHQLMATEHNAGALADRKYSITNLANHKSHLPVVESELSALELLRHGLEAGAGVGINYCSRHYKALFQAEASRRVYAPLCMREGDSLTATGFIRSLGAGVPDLKTTLPGNSPGDREKSGRMPGSGAEGTGSWPGDLRRATRGSDEVRYPVTIHYHKAEIEQYADQEPDSGRVAGFGGKEVFIRRDPLLDVELSNSTSALFFQCLFVDRRSPAEAVEDVLRAYGLEASRGPDILADLTEFREEFKGLEFRPERIPEYD